MSFDSRSARTLRLAVASSLAILHLYVAQSAFAQEGQGSAAAGTSEPTATKQVDPQKADAAAGATDSEKFLRVKDVKNKLIALEIASRNYTRQGAEGPKVGLVGVAHIGERSFYRSVQKLLEEYDVVLFESVKPKGTGGAGGETDEERVAGTKAALEFMAGLIESSRVKQNSYPADAAAIRELAGKHDARMASMVDSAMVDGWGNALEYKYTPAAKDGAAPPEGAEAAAADPGSFSLVSLGSDGKPGGDGVAADIAASDLGPIQPLSSNDEDNLQGQLAEALGLEFQLDSLDYSLENWRCSDMAMDQVERSFEKRGLDFGPLGGTLAGSSLPAKLIGLLLNFMRIADQWAEGAISDAFKIVLIDMLSDETVTRAGLAQFGEGFHDVIVIERNQVAIDDLKRIIEKEPQVKSVAILYGAAHMADMARQMHEQLGYEPADDTWLTAVEVDLTETALSPREVLQMRAMIRQAVRQQFGRMSK